MPSKEFDNEVGDFSANRKQQDASDNDAGSTGHLPVVHEVTNALAGSHQFRGDNEHPAKTETAAQSSDIGGHGGRQDHATDQIEPPQTKDAADLDQFPVHVQDANHEVQ